MNNFLALYTDHNGNTQRQFVIASGSLKALDVAEHIRASTFNVSKILVRSLFDVEKIALGTHRGAEAAALNVAMSTAYGSGPVLALLSPQDTDELLSRLAKKLWTI